VAGTPAARAGVVTVPVTAEAGSKIRIANELMGVIKTVVATGGAQRVSFRGEDGQHTYYVTAVDAAGNESSEASIEMAVDATAPMRPQVNVTPPRAGEALTAVALSGEAGARWALRVSRRGMGVVRGLAHDGVFDDAGEASLTLLAGNGAYLISTTTADSAGNTSAAAPVPLNVAVPPPVVTVTRTTAANVSEMRLSVTGPALGRGTLRLVADGPPPVEQDIALDELGAATVTADVTDQIWAAIATVTDFQHRTATGGAYKLLVDTVAPALSASVDRAAAEHGELVVAFAVDAGSAVTVSGLPGEPRTYTDAGPHQLRVPAKDGTHKIKLLAMDTAGNRTEQVLPIRVSTPATAGALIIGFVALALMLLASILLVRYFWRRRWQIRAVLTRARLTAQHKTAMAKHAGALRAHEQAVIEARAAHAWWVQQGAYLQQVASEAREYRGHAIDGSDMGVKARPEEVAFAHVTQAGLVELRRPQGVDVPTIVDRGELWVTNTRVIYNGSAKRREWSFDKLVSKHDHAHDTTLLMVSNRQTISGFAYPGSHQGETRRHLGLALATFAGTRGQLVQAADAAMTVHARAEPVGPGPAPQPPEAPVLPTAESLRQAAETKRDRPAPAWTG
jgi:hypothetical protein